MRGFWYLCVAAAAVWAGPVLALGVNGAAGPRASNPGTDSVPAPPVLLAQDAGETGKTVEPMPGELIIPQNSLKPSEPAEDDERNCMTVCVRWGEECLLINKGAGGMERKCRRTCKQLGEECL
ncbi:MAG: hypothetical protein HYY48_11215 [Gammaproteobacteria bacterium]|nr:hypothetical protein [Gammaproteobacteria bacterium]